MTFEEFSESLERMCLCGWRAGIGRGNYEFIEAVNSILFTRERHDGEWKFSLSLRVGKTWHQATGKCAPVEYDVLQPVAGERTPTSVACDVCQQMFDGIRRDVASIYDEVAC